MRYSGSGTHCNFCITKPYWHGLKRLDLEIKLYVLMGLNTGITIFESRNEFYMKFSIILWLQYLKSLFLNQLNIKVHFKVESFKTLSGRYRNYSQLTTSRWLQKQIFSPQLATSRKRPVGNRGFFRLFAFFRDRSLIEKQMCVHLFICQIKIKINSENF